MRILLILGLAALANLSFLAGCGQKGGLVLPERADQTAIEEEQEEESN